LINLEPKQEINDEWEQIKTAVVDPARDVVRTQGRILQEKNEARKKWLRLKTRISWNIYINKRNQAIKFAHRSRKNGSAIK
jgi:hypothetical protein